MNRSYRELGRLVLRLVLVQAMKTIPRVSASLDPCIGTDVGACFSPYQLRAPATLGGTGLNRYKHRSVRSNIAMVLAFVYRVLVMTSSREATPPRSARDGARKLGSLKAALEVIIHLYANHEVSFRPLPQNPLSQIHLQESVAVGNKVENLLSRINALEERFGSRPDDVAEQRRRGKLIRYAML